MNLIESSLIHVVRPPEGAQQGGKHPTLVMLHGRGADEHDLLGLAPFLDGQLLVISVRAPSPFPQGGGFTWYEMNERGGVDPATFRSSFDQLCAFVGEAKEGYPVDPENVFLLGFSMGTMMAYALSLTAPELYRGVIANSGFVPDHQGLELRWSDLSGTDFFIAHGEFDPVIPVELGRRTKRLFEDSNASVDYREYPMGHEISQSSLADSAAWLNDRLGK